MPSILLSSGRNGRERGRPSQFPGRPRSPRRPARSPTPARQDRPNGLSLTDTADDTGHPAAASHPPLTCGFIGRRSAAAHRLYEEGTAGISPSTPWPGRDATVTVRESTWGSRGLSDLEIAPNADGSSLLSSPTTGGRRRSPGASRTRMTSGPRDPQSPRSSGSSMRPTALHTHETFLAIGRNTTPSC